MRALLPAALAASALLAPVAAAQPAAEPPPVVVAVVRLLPLPLVVEALGTARANESVEIRSQVTDKVTAIRFEEGASVEAGTVLLELEDSEEKAAVAEARATLLDSESQLRRARALIKTSAVSASELDRRAAQRDADQAVLEAARARLADTRVVAPFAGRVGLRRVSPGSLVTPETVITTLDDTDPIKLDFDVPETHLARLAIGLAVEASSAAWPDETFPGVVVSIDTRVDPVSRTITVRARVPNPDGRLRPGMFLRVALRRDDVEALVVPEQALVREESRQYVLVVGPDAMVERREVRVGRRQPGRVEILEGVVAGERIVAEGTQRARPGHPVEVVGEIELAEVAP
jgi:membrane fusion protein (multidrug efflux system)